MDREDYRAFSIFRAVAPLAEFGLSGLALELMPELCLTPTEAAGLLARLGLLVEHARLQRAAAMESSDLPERIPPRRGRR